MSSDSNEKDDYIIPYNTDDLLLGVLSERPPSKAVGTHLITFPNKAYGFKPLLLTTKVKTQRIVGGNDYPLERWRYLMTCVTNKR